MMKMLARQFACNVGIKSSKNGTLEGSMRNEDGRMGRLKTVYIRRFNISEIVEMLRIFVFVFFLSLLLLFIFFG